MFVARDLTEPNELAKGCFFQLDSPNLDGVPLGRRFTIAHLNASSMKAEVNAILLDILEAHRLLFPGQRWVEFRTNYVASTGEYSDKEGLFTGDDYTHDKICREIDAALNELSPKDGMLYFRYERRKKGLRCPRCLELRNGDEEWSFAQKNKDGSIECIACLSVFDKEEYVRKIVEYFGYLDEDERGHVEAETRQDVK